MSRRRVLQEACPVLARSRTVFLSCTVLGGGETVVLPNQAPRIGVACWLAPCSRPVACLVLQSTLLCLLLPLPLLLAACSLFLSRPCQTWHLCHVPIATRCARVCCPPSTRKRSIQSHGALCRGTPPPSPSVSPHHACCCTVTNLGLRHDPSSSSFYHNFPSEFGLPTQSRVAPLRVVRSVILSAWWSASFGSQLSSGLPLPQHIHQTNMKRLLRTPR